jgi:hypothetical protein
MDKDVLESLARYFAEHADRPFGDVESISGRTLQPFSIAGQEAARNLLDKAGRALDDGDLDRARGFVDRAVRLPFDKHEQGAPVAIAVHMELFCLVTDELERSEVDDPRWLDAALDVLATDESSQCEMRDVLAAIDQDYTLRPRDRAQLRSAVASIPDRPELRDQDLGPSELGDQVMSVLATCRKYRATLAAPAD